MTPTLWQVGHLAWHSAASGHHILSTIIWSCTRLPNPCSEVLFSIATLIQSRGLFLLAGLEHTVSSSLPSRWARERPDPRGHTLYLKLNDWAEILWAKAARLTMLFTELAWDAPAQIGDLSPWQNMSVVLGQGLNLTFTPQSTHVSSEFLLASWEEVIFFHSE